MQFMKPQSPFYAKTYWKTNKLFTTSSACLFACLLMMTACSDEPKTEPKAPVTSSQNTESQPKQVASEASDEQTDQQANEDLNLDDLDSLLTDVATTKPKQTANSAWSDGGVKNQGDVTIAKHISKGLAMGFNYELQNSSRWDDEQIRCFGKLDYGFAVNDIQRLIISGLTNDEFNKATKFYGSSTGKYIDRWMTRHVAELAEGETPTVDDLNLSEQGRVEFVRFMGSSADRKLERLINSYQMENIIVSKTKGRLMACDML